MTFGTFRTAAWFLLGIAASAACGTAPARDATDGASQGSPGSRDGGEAPPAPDAGASDALPAGDHLPSGANVQSGGGVAFHLWAPHATGAWVTGDFPEGKVAMTAVAGGAFEAHVAGAHAGSTYAFELDSPSGKIRRIDPYCRDVALDRQSCRVVDPSSYAWQSPTFTRPARAASIVYEMHVGSFTSAGTFQAARARLGELADLGVNVVELMPVHAFGGKANSWGYNPHLWHAPKPDYGSPDDLRAFIDDAHAHGIAVWTDFVVNHYDGWDRAPLHCFDGLCPSGSDGVYFFGAGPYARTPWGPRPDYTEPEVSKMLLSSVEQWLTEFRGDGFRWDSVSNIRALDGQGTTPGGRELLVAANERTHQLGGTSVAEDLKGWDGITKPVSQQGLGFDAQWDGFGWDVNDVITPYSDDARDMNVVARALQGGYAGDPFARLLWIENHDTVGNGGARFPTKVDAANPESIAARRRTMLAASLLFTTPGVPMLFMGQEALDTHGFTDPPAPLATPTAAGAKVRAFYKDAIALRRALPDLATPSVKIFHKNDTNKVVGFRRGDVVVVLNFRNKAYARYDVGVPSAGPYHVRLDTESKTYGDDLAAGQTGTIATIDAARDGEPYTLPLQLPPYGAMILTP